MITAVGRNHIRRYLAQYVPTIGGAVAFGIGARNENLADLALQFETTRAAVNQVYYDFATNKLVFKTGVPSDYVGDIYEVGLYSIFEDTLAGNFGSKTIVSFDSIRENWIDSTTLAPEAFGSVGARIGGDSLTHTPAASTTKSSTLGMNIDLSGYSGTDLVTMAFSVGNNNTTKVELRFLVDSANYFSFTDTSACTTAGYKIVEYAKGNAAVTGSPKWDSIAEVRVLTTSGAAGVSSLGYDGIRLVDLDTNSLDHILVARKVLALPTTKIAGQEKDIEISLDITV